MARTRVMGVVNVTPDSVSDGGSWPTADAAAARGLELVAQGADLVDVGGESTRPGAARVEAQPELTRVLPVVEALVGAGVEVSVDTTRASLADAALRAGASWVNDVSGGLADPAMLDTVARRGGGYIAMHWRGHSRAMQERAVYGDVVAEVSRELAARRDAALAAGIDPARLVLDPGIGFAKSADHNWEVLRHWSVFEALGFPLLLAVSRKRFLGVLLGSEPHPVPPGSRDDATAALTAVFAARGVWAVRVHEVRANRDAVDVAARLRGEHG